MSELTAKDLIEKNLFELLGIEDSSDEYKQQLIKTMSTTVDARVINRVGELLGESDATEFGRLAEEGNTEAIASYLVERGIDLPAIVVDEATRHRTELVSIVNLLQQKQ